MGWLRRRLLWREGCGVVTGVHCERSRGICVLIWYRCLSYVLRCFDFFLVGVLDTGAAWW